MNVLWIRNGCMLLHRRQADAACAFTRWQHFSVWNDIIATSLIVWRQIMIGVHSNILAEFYSNLIWNDRALHFFEEVAPRRKITEKNNISSDVRSVPDPKIVKTGRWGPTATMWTTAPIHRHHPGICLKVIIRKKLRYLRIIMWHGT